MTRESRCESGGEVEAAERSAGLRGVQTGEGLPRTGALAGGSVPLSRSRPADPLGVTPDTPHLTFFTAGRSGAPW